MDILPKSPSARTAAQAEHGGFYQSVADGTYEACGLDVTILPGPQPGADACGRIDFYMGGHLDAYFAVAEGLPIVNVMVLPEGPQ